MRYMFEVEGKTVAVLTMPDDMECFSIIGAIMDKTGAKFATLEKDEPVTLSEDDERSKRIWDMVNEMEA